jgi:signal transduction histidine kinase
MAWSGSDAKLAGRRFSRVQRSVVWLRGRRDLVIALTVAGVAVAFALDLLIPGYAIAGLYLLPLLLVAFALGEERAVVIIGVLCLGLTVLTMVLQGRTNGQNILLVGFGALAGVGLIGLGYLYQRFDQLYERERATTSRLHALADQLQRLQEVSVLDSDRPLSELLRDIVVQAQQLLGSDGGRLFRLDTAARSLTLEAEAGSPHGVCSAPLPAGDGVMGVAIATRRAAVVPDLAAASARASAGLPAEPPPVTATAGDRGPGEGPLGRSQHGACLFVPLVVRDDVWGVIALSYVSPRRFGDDDIGLASSFGDQAALAIENARLREQVERSAVAAERSRLARELHDSVTQSLFAASLKAEALLRAPESDPAQARENLRDVRRLTRGALAEMRTLLLEMRPGALAQAPLGDLLDHVVQATQARTRASIELRVGDLRPLPPDVTIAFYRIAQEALNNMVRHAEAGRAWVTLTSSDDVIELVVRDDGRGFDPSSAGPEQLGLRIMRERAEAVGAGLRIDTAIGRGAAVTTTWSAERR